MTAPGTERQPTSGKPGFRIKTRWKVLALLVALFVLGWEVPPFYGFAWRIASIPFTDSIKQWPDAAARHTDWFKRFYTGPKPDAYYIDLLAKYKPLLDSAAETCIQTGCNRAPYNPPVPREALELEEKSGLRIAGRRVEKSHLNTLNFGNTMAPQVYLLNEEEQQWSAAKHRCSMDINQRACSKSWSKALIYIPSLKSNDGKSAAPLDVAYRSGLFIAESLDSIPSEEMDMSGDLPLPKYECAARQIEKHWLITLCSHYTW